MSFDFDSEPEVVEEPPASAIVVAPKANLTREERFRAAEDKVFEQQAAIVRDMGYFRDIDPENPELPDEWVDELGYTEAMRRFRIARASWEPAKNAPVGLTLAVKTVAGISKARANQTHAPLEVNMAVQFVVGPMAQYPEKKVGGR